ncbi:MAG: hypothetical protein K2M94_05495, partial [Paramuribaculum sp.]|nr:hypothetical protein [Paramuribaculum sp.]
MAQQQAAGTGLQLGNNSAPTTFTLNNDKSWYFYNTATKNAGRTEFQKRWGSRKLEDDWRRRNKVSYAFTDAEDEQEYDDVETVETDENVVQQEKLTGKQAQLAQDPHYPEYYLKQIPKTDAERTIANDVIQEGLYNEGLILKDKLEDYSAAASVWANLLERYPDNVYRLDVYYNLYLMYMRAGQDARAEKYRDLILSDFADTKYGEALSDPLYMDKLRRMHEVECELYDAAYQAYLDNDNRRVHQIFEQMRHDYPMSRIMPKFMFIEALSYVTENNPEKFASTLRTLIERYPDTDVSPLASSYLELLSKGNKFNTSASNVRGIVWSTRLSNDSTQVSVADEPAQFEFDATGEQLLVLIYSTSKVNANQLLFDVARHNFSTYTVKDFDIEQMRFGSLGLLVISGFNNMAEVTRYRSMLESSGMKLPDGVVPLIISRYNFDLLIDEGRTLDEYFNAVGDNRLEEIHKSLQPDEKPTAEAHEVNTAAEAPVEDVPAETEESGSTVAGEQPQLQPKPESAKDDDLPFDIPVPPSPAKKAPVLKPLQRGSNENRVTVYPLGSEGDDPLLD